MAVKVRRIVKYEVEVPNLGSRIKQAREASEKSLTQLAKDAGISRHYWYQVESETVFGGIAEDTLRKIEKVLGCDFGVKVEQIVEAEK